LAIEDFNMVSFQAAYIGDAEDETLTSSSTKS
jgi:hypothetical protein